VARYDLKPNPYVPGWASTTAKAEYDSFRVSNDHRIGENESLAGFIGRSSEMSTRLATIRAAGRWIGDTRFTVDRSDMEWAVAVVRAASGRLIDEVAGNLVEDLLSHGELHNKVVAVVKKAGKRGILHSALVRSLQKQAKAKELKDVIGQLVDSETFDRVQVTPPAGGHPAIYYRIK
jgi:hypothetical protein